MVGLLADTQEQHLVALDDVVPGGGLCWCVLSQDGPLPITTQVPSVGVVNRLLACASNSAASFFGHLSPDGCSIHRIDNPSWRQSIPVGPEELKTGIVGALPHEPDVPFCLLFFENEAKLFRAQQLVAEVALPAGPENPTRSTLLQSPVHGFIEQNNLVVRWTSKDGRLFTMQVGLGPNAWECSLPVELRTWKTVFGIQGSLDPRQVSAEPASIWDSLKEEWIEQFANPVAAFPMGIKRCPDRRCQRHTFPCALIEWC